MSGPDNLRPKTLDEIIGQDQIRETAQVFIHAARERGAAMDHVLMKGRPGLGKTTFALAIAQELGKKVINVTGPSLKLDRIEQIVRSQLTEDPRMKRIRRIRGGESTVGGVLFIDEVHAIPSEAFELLYPLMEQFSFHGDAVDPFTLIGATTDPGKLPAPFRDRFGISFTIDYYPDDEMLELAERSYRTLGGHDGSEVQDSLETIANRARGTPRVVNRLIRRCMDFMVVRKLEALTTGVVSDTMQALGIDSLGLDEVDRKILVALSEINRPVGLAAVASKIGEDMKTIELVHEPYLVREGYVERGQRGRELSGLGKAFAYEIIEGRIQW